MNINKAFTYPVEDEQWTSKLGLGALISIVPILNLAWVGYYTDIMHSVSEGVSVPLPEWNDLGEKFLKGLVISVAGFIYTLPALLVGFLSILVAFFASLSGGQEAEEAIANAFVGPGGFAMCCLVLYMLLFGFIFPAIHLHYARESTFGSCFQIKSILGLISSNIGDYLLAWAVLVVFGLALGFIVGVLSIGLSLIPCAGWIITLLLSAGVTVWTSIVYAHLIGQVGSLEDF